MTRNEIIEQLGPCGLYCGKCFAFENGSIQKHSTELLKALGNFEPYAQRFITLLEEPVFENYPRFKEVLTLFSEGYCKGCRKNNCKLFKGCKVRDCTFDKRVDFCFECPEFPCDHSGFDDNLKKRWIISNKRMMEAGVETYFNEIKDKSRY